LVTHQAAFRPRFDVYRLSIYNTMYWRSGLSSDARQMSFRHQADGIGHHAAIGIVGQHNASRCTSVEGEGSYTIPLTSSVPVVLIHGDSCWISCVVDRVRRIAGTDPTPDPPDEDLVLTKGRDVRSENGPTGPIAGSSVGTITVVVKRTRRTVSPPAPFRREFGVQVVDDDLSRWALRWTARR
jgi:hypothetical protein